VSNSFYDSLTQNNLVIPYVENAITAPQWPESFVIPIRDHDSVKDDYFHPSSHAVTPERLLYYLLHPEHRQHLAKRKESPMDILSPLLGTVFHVIIQQKLIAVGLITADDIEVPLTNEEHHGRGHMDFVFRNHPHTQEDVPVDIKTASPANFERMYQPSASYVAQLQLYMDWLPSPAEEGVIFVIEMGRPFRMKEFRLTRDSSLLNSIYARWASVSSAITNDAPPQTKCCALNSPTMQKCPARAICLETY
jgi:hypothetical protein